MGMQEETYYSDGTNWVTNQRLIFEDAQYPLGDAISAEMKAEYPQKVVLARVAIVVGLAILFGLVVFFEGKGGDPAFAQASAAANIIAIVGGLAFYSYLLRADYLKQPSFRKAIQNIALFMVMAAILILWFSFRTKSSSLEPFWFVSFMVGLNLWRILGRQGTFRLLLVERTGTVDVLSSTDRQLVENLIGYVRLALIKRSNPTPINVKSPS
jgi:hypothetical protein